MNASARIAKSLEKATGKKGKRFAVKMRGVRELGRFIKTLRDAQKAAGEDTTRYGDSLAFSTEGGAKEQ